MRRKRGGADANGRSTSAFGGSAGAEPAANASSSDNAGAASTSPVTNPHWTWPGETSADGRQSGSETTRIVWARPREDHGSTSP